MRRTAFVIALLFAGAAHAQQNVTVIGPVTPGDIPQFSSTTILKDSSFSPSSFQPALSLDLRNYAVNPETFSTVCTGLDDTATWQAAVNAAAAIAGQTIGIPALSCKSTATGVSLLNSIDVKIVGQGAGVGADTASVTAFNTTSTTGSLITAPGANGIDIGNIRLSYSSASYNGNLIELSQGAGAQNTEFVTIHDCFLGGTSGTAVNAASLIHLNLTLVTTVRNCYLQNAAYGIKGETSSNNVRLDGLWFNEGFSASQILADGEAWLEVNSNHEPATACPSSCIAAAFNIEGTLNGSTLLSNSYNDATSGHWLDFTGGTANGHAEIGNAFQGATYVGTLGAMSGGLIAGNYLNTSGGGNCAFFGASARGIVAFGNAFSTPGGPNVGSLWCDSGPTIGSNFYQTASTTAGLTEGFALTQHLDILNYAGTANTSLDGLFLKNPTAATSGNQQWSPRVHWQGQGWKTNATAASQSVDFLAELQTVQGTTNPSGKLVISAQVNGSGYTGLYAFDSAGNAAIGTSLALGGGSIGSDALEVTGTTTHNGAVAVVGGALSLSGNQSLAAWTTSGVKLKGIASTLTDTTSSGTVAAAYTNVLGGNTIAASSAATFTNYFGLYVNDPVQGTNVTLTNKWALGADSAKFGTSNQVTISNAGLLTAPGAIAMGGSNITGVGNIAATTFNGNTITTGTGTLTMATGTSTTISGNFTVNAGGLAITPAASGLAIWSAGNLTATSAPSVTSLTASGDVMAATYHVGSTAGASCTLTVVAHLTVVNGIVTLCN